MEPTIKKMVAGPKPFTIEFRLILGEDASATLDETTPHDFVKYFEERHKERCSKSKEDTIFDHLSCCAFRGGFFITVDGRLYNLVDEFWMTYTWIYGLKQILEERATTNTDFSVAYAYPWEEGQVCLQR